MRGWRKYKVREAIVGAVTGSLTAPTRLLLGGFDDGGACSTPAAPPLSRTAVLQDVRAVLAVGALLQTVPVVLPLASPSDPADHAHLVRHPVRAARPGRITVTTTASTASAVYWEPLWAQGRQYRPLCEAEKRLMDQQPGPGNGRPALDIGSGAGALARHLCHELGYRTTGVDCSPSAVALAAAQGTGPGPGPTWRCLDITADDHTALPESAYALITCHLVHRWMDDKSAFLDRVRRLVAPGGTFRVVTEIAGRRTTTDLALLRLGITPADTELLTTGWSVVRTADLDVLRCYALRL
ncbi:class I SAM-dependent methyltransferase [Streptomyces sp. NPDC006368]|uniref:class I SAM-dependent methyltransferase n=1 Tax=Streptomyces sp. NPDC006368 TaxID=3156760 RepID=UPI0033A2EED2